MRCYTLIRFHGILGFRVSIMPPITKTLRSRVFWFFFKHVNDMLRYIESDDVKPNCHLSIFFFFVRRINVPNMWQRQLYFPLFQSSSPSLWVWEHPVVPLPFRQQRKPGRCDKSGLTWKSPPTRQRFSTWSTPDPVALSEPKIGLLFFPPPFFFSLARHSRFFKAQRDQALKSTLSLIQ